MCHEQYPKPVCVVLWVLSEISIIALDLTMVLGTAIGLNLLFRLPLLPCILMTSLDVVLILWVEHIKAKQGARWSELLTIALVALVLLCFLVDVFLSAPPVNKVLGGLWPRIEPDSLYTAVSLLGANVMPHNFYLHSALVKGRPREGRSVAAMCQYNFIDVTCALGAALLINLAVLVVSAATFHSAGIAVETLQDAHDLMEQLLSSSIAPAVFGLALIFAGQLSTFTGTISGQVVLKGFLDVEISPWLRRLTTRAAAIVPAAVITQLYGDQGIYKLLVVAQIVLALQLPFTLVPLIKATSSSRLMGPFANGWNVQMFSWGATTLIFLANLMFLVSMMVLPEQQAYSAADYTGSDWPSGIRLWLGQVARFARQSPMQFSVLLSLVLLASSAVGLLLWMLGMPLTYAKDASWSAMSSIDSEESALENGEAGDSAHGSQGATGDAIKLPSKALSIKDARLGCWGGNSWEDLLQDLRPLLQEIVMVPDTAGALQANPTQNTIPDSWPLLPSQSSVADYSPADGGSQTTDSEVQTTSRSPPRVQPHLGRGMRRQAVAAMDAFWSRFFDLHGRPLYSFSPVKEASPPPSPHSQSGNPLTSIANDLAVCLGELYRLEGGPSLFEVRRGTVWEKNDHMMAQLCALMVQKCQGFNDLGGHRQGNALAAEGQGEHTGQWNCGCGADFIESVQPWCCLGKWAQEWVLCDPRDLLYVFGLWCMVRLLELCKMEPRPELWGRYAAVLNRLQWMLPTMAVDDSGGADNGSQREVVFQLLSDVASSVNSKRGPKGTTAGDVAFPKGKEIIMSVIKRYNRGLRPGGQRVGARSDKRARTIAVTGQSLAAALLMTFTVVALCCTGGNEVRSTHMM
eukprot:evm.model.scf_229.1 EVM.evm.TU.scf_229.1   scf_229:2594-9836(-)